MDNCLIGKYERSLNLNITNLFMFFSIFLISGLVKKKWTNIHRIALNPMNNINIHRGFFFLLNPSQQCNFKCRVYLF